MKDINILNAVEINLLRSAKKEQWQINYGINIEKNRGQKPQQKFVKLRIQWHRRQSVSSEDGE